jgi:hypothetical protein
MDNEVRESYTDTAARIISVIFHPVFMPLYGMLIIFSAHTLFGFLPFSVKKILFSIVLLNNVFLPLSIIPYLKYRNQIKSWSMDTRRERILPLFIASVLYAATSYIIIRYPVPLFIKTYITGIFVISLALTAVNLWWKISVHATAIGSVTAMVVVLTFRMSSHLLWPVLVVFICSGLILSSRLKLNAHNPAEVWTGYLTGFAGLGLLMWLI